MRRAFRVILGLSDLAVSALQIGLNLFIVVTGAGALVMISLIAINVFKHGLLPLINHVR